MNTIKEQEWEKKLRGDFNADWSPSSQASSSVFEALWKWFIPKIRSSHSQLLQEIEERVKKTELTFRFSPPYTRDDFEGKDSLGYDGITKNIHNAALAEVLTIINSLK